MENASKALLIAGAILIVIILIGIGVAIINSTDDLQDQAASSANSMAIQTFNSQFTSYQGNKVSANQVRALISLINASNASNGFTSAPTNNATDKYVYLDNTEVTGKTVLTLTSPVPSNKTYTVNVTGYSAGGYVNKIQVYY